MKSLIAFCLFRPFPARTQAKPLSPPPLILAKTNTPPSIMKCITPSLNDGLDDAIKIIIGTDKFDDDTDNDGLKDGEEDSDGDGVKDCDDACPSVFGTNPDGCP